MIEIVIGIVGFILGYVVAYGFGAFKNKVQEDEVIVKKAILKEYEAVKNEFELLKKRIKR